MIKYSVLFFSFILILTSCSGVKEGLTGSRKNNSDEFLVQKKNPLVQPPNFNELPKPNNKKSTKIKSNEKQKVQKLLEDYTVESKTETKTKKTQSLEDSILEKIKSK